MAKASDNKFPSILVTEQASKPAAPVAGDQRIYMKTDHKLYHEDSGGTETEIGASGSSGGGKGLSYVDRNDKTNGDITLNSTSFKDVDNTLDLSLTAQSGDVILVGLSASLGAEGVYADFDACTVVSGSPVSYLSTSGSAPAAGGISSWKATTASYHGVGATIIYTLLPGDISDSSVSFRLRYRTESSSNRTLYADTSVPLSFFGVNLSR